MKTLESNLGRLEAAEVLGISVSKVDKDTASGQLIATKIGRRTVYQPRHLRAYLEAQTREVADVNRSDELELAALTVLQAVQHRMDGEATAMTHTLRGTGREVSLRLCEAVEILAYLVRLSDRPAEMLAALRERVNTSGN